MQVSARGPVDVTIGGKKLGPMMLAEVSCAGELGRNDIAVLVFKPVPPAKSA